MQDVIRSLKNNKAASPDGIPAEILKEATVLSSLHSLWRQVSNRDASLCPPCLAYSSPPSSTLLAKTCHRESQSSTDGRLFNLNKKAKSKINTIIIVELQYMDSNAIAAHSAFAKAYLALGLSLNIKKTQVLHQPPPNQLSIQPTIKVNNITLQNVDHFPYLGSLLFTAANINSEINHRLR
ncbi:hypothetical protein LDENG_00193520 [Lucifuga dentata]|nr:hypothetical protein LDENG_00193520 [Lucifuga dentata]